MKIKMKTRRAAAKRFRKATANGKLTRSKRNHGHFLAKMGGRKAGKLQGTTYVSASDYNTVNALLPGLGAKKKRTKAIKRAVAAAAAAK